MNLQAYRAAAASVSAAFMLAFAPVASAQPFTSVVKVPFVVNAAAQADIAACVGEAVSFTEGTFNVVRHFGETPSGGGMFLFHRNVMGGLGVGTATGTIYQATGHLQSFDVAPPSGGEVVNFELVLNVVGRGNAGHFTAHAVEHLTFTPDGDLASVVEIDSIRCTG